MVILVWICSDGWLSDWSMLCRQYHRHPGADNLLQSIWRKYADEHSLYCRLRLEGIDGWHGRHDCHRDDYGTDRCQLRIHRFIESLRSIVRRILSWNSRYDSSRDDSDSVFP